MATTVEQHPAQTLNGAEQGREGIPVENPATGEIVATVPDLGGDAVAEMARQARAAQPAWEELGFEGRGRILLRAQKWLMDNAQQVIETIVSETGKTYEDAEFAEIAYGANAFGFWAREAPNYLKDERVKSSQLMVKGKKIELRYRPLGLIGVIGPWNYPLTNSFGDCIPAMAAGNAVILKPSRGDAADVAAAGRGAARVRPAGARPADRHRPRRDGRGAGGRGRHDHVHGLDGHRAQGRRNGRQAPDPGLAGAGWQGPDAGA